MLAELRGRAPHAIDWTAMGDVVPILDEFEAARASRRPATIKAALDALAHWARGYSDAI
jgi:hypothetical protein